MLKTFYRIPAGTGAARATPRHGRSTMVTQTRPAGPFGRHALIRRPGYLGAALAMLLLSGCSNLDLFNIMGQDEAPDETAATFDPETGARKPASPTGEASPRAKPAPPPPKAATEIANAPALKLDPDNIVGLNEIDAERLFGVPHFVIRQQPATRWHYVSRTCTLDLFFFEDLETRARRVLAYDVGSAAPNPAAEAEAEKSTNPTDRDLKACATSIQAERNDSTG